VDAGEFGPPDEQDETMNTKGPGKRSDTFERKVFRVSRLADFATIDELVKQTGQPVENWVLVIVKELVDNALDEAEKAGVAPVVEITVTDNAITVADHGRGIASATIKSLVDYSFRTSSNAAYVSPTRGQQGNALQILFAMPFVLDGREGEVLVESQGVAHTIRFSIDAVRQTPVVNHVKDGSAVRNGTRVTVRWPDSPRSLIADAESGFLSLIATYVWVNPHLKLTSDWRGTRYGGEWATDPGWTKWRPDMPTSAHWYDEARLSRLMAAYIADAEDRRTPCQSVRDFIGLFRGLKGTQIAASICETLEIAGRETLADFYARPGAALKLLTSLRASSRPVKPRDLGVIRATHLQARLVEHGCAEDSVVYRKAEIEHDGMPYMIEVAFGYRGEDSGKGLRIAEGFNFSPAVGGSPFDLQGLFGQAQIERDDPVTVFIHAASPRLAFLDRGKARVALPHTVAGRLADLVTSASAKWTKQKTAEIRSSAAFWRRRDAMIRRDKPMKQKAAAASVMTIAYMIASANGTLPANPRQIFYAARPRMLEKTKLEKLDSRYFTQTLLPDFMNANPGLTEGWNIAWDDRGHFTEPHTGREIGLGTLAVKDYIRSLSEMKIEPASIAAAKVTTRGPKGRYAGVLYIEKEGFTAILEAAEIAKRYDLAIASSKGMSVTACRMLVEELCGRQGLPLFILHDFDKAGFSILKTLFTSNRRYTFKHKIVPIDLGLRLEDVIELNLPSEPVSFGKRKRKASEDEDFDDDSEVGDSKEAAALNLRDNGATQAEIDYMLTGEGNTGRRVELNAMPSDVFVAFVERKLTGHGLRKVIPAAETLAETYAAFKRSQMAAEALEAELARLNATPVDTPAELRERVDAYLEANPAETWDDALQAIMEDER
jgi:Histidine kinase-, DNA gyrase B-, and HSP90-like ATPase